jgi:hypothetical protein
LVIEDLLLVNQFSMPNSQSTPACPDMFHNGIVPGVAGKTGSYFCADALAP